MSPSHAGCWLSGVLEDLLSPCLCTCLEPEGLICENGDLAEMPLGSLTGFPAGISHGETHILVRFPRAERTARHPPKPGR